MEAITGKKRKEVDASVLREKIGTIPDKELAAELGVQSQTIRKYRKKFNLPSFKPNKAAK
jgi:FixJ family two-component response regulator